MTLLDYLPFWFAGIFLLLPLFTLQLYQFFKWYQKRKRGSTIWEFNWIADRKFKDVPILFWAFQALWVVILLFPIS